MDKKYRRLLSNTAILTLGTIGSKLLVFLLSKDIVRSKENTSELQ